MSIKPKYSHKIITQKKTIEIRKKIGIKFKIDEYIYIYSSAPDKKIVGYFQIDSIIEFDKDKITNELLLESCLSKNEMLNYIKDDKAYGIKIKNIYLSKTISLQEIRNVFRNFNPPQSFRYIQADMLDYLKKNI